jgi:hypothetical protein
MKEQTLYLPTLPRISELICKVQQAYPKDTFFANLPERLNELSQALLFYQAYERALSCLDAESWAILSEKAVKHFCDHRPGQLKQGFFNQLNEAFAYEYLLGCACQSVRLLPEDGATKTPDIAYIYKQVTCFCEVKTIGISEEEIQKRKSAEAHEYFYAELPEEFFNKLNKTLNAAVEQIQSKGPNGLIYTLVIPDDFTGTYFDTYQEQLQTFIQNYEFPDVYIKLGILGLYGVKKRSV